ncbi:helix-turn-helix transcriptional regulator [Streptomyces capparidis]
MSANPDDDLGAFLRTRRARLRPADVGLPDHGGRRRVPGLRREELAALAGISVGYYTRLEQGQGGAGASDGVLDAVGRVLGLDEAELAHLRRLARPGRARARPERLRPSVRAVVEAFGHAPALVLGRRADVLAWNRPAHALFAPHLDADAPDRPGSRPNIVRMVFLDPWARELYPDWPGKCHDAAADLRLAAGRHPGDPGIAALVAELTGASEEFAALWAAHPVQDCGTVTREYRHPVAGRLVLAHELLHLRDDGQRLAVLTAAPGSPSAAALGLLAAGAPGDRAGSR